VSQESKEEEGICMLDRGRVEGWEEYQPWFTGWQPLFGFGSYDKKEAYVSRNHTMSLWCNFLWRK
jgi:hypothetical protein